MKKDLTLIEFLENTGAQIRLYDMGRRIREIPRDEFLAFERTEIPYPLPMQRQAWFAIVQIRALDLTEPVIWFMRLNLDEQGKLVQATRDYLIHRFVEIASESQDKEQADLGKALEDNPYTFKPREDRMGVFHAKFSYALNLPPSRFYEHAKEYFAGNVGWDQWNFVGYQGIADLAVRAGDTEIAETLTKAISDLPVEPLNALCQCLENEVPPTGLTEVLVQRLSEELEAENTDVNLVASLIRGLSQMQNESERAGMLKKVLEHDCARQIEVLAAISGRAWTSLLHADVAKQYLDVLAVNDVGQDAFNHCLGDLLTLPGMQQPLLNVLRDPSRSEQLAKSFQAMTESPD